MARKFLVPVDLQKNELQNAVVQNLSGSPASPVPGQIYFDSTTSVLYYYNGAGWVNAGGISAGLLSARPTVSAANAGSFFYATDNDLVYYSDGTVWNQLNPFGTVANLGSSAANGSSTDYARADHVHRHSNTDHSAINLSALSAPAANVSWGGYKITNLAEPTADQDAATKYYVDNAIAGLDWKEAVHLIATTNVALTGTSGTLVIDGHTALDGADAGYRLLLIGQSTAANNGIYVYADNSTAYTLTRSADADVYTELLGASVFVSEGTAYGKTSWVQSNHYLTSFSGQDWVQFSGAGTYNAGAGLALDGNIFNVGTASTTRVVVNADNIDLATVSQTNSTGNTSATIVQAVAVDSYGRVTGVTSGTHSLTSTTSPGIASFADANFSISSGAVSAKDITLTAGSGITLSTTAVTLGGALTVTNAGVTSLTAGTGVSISAGTGGVTLTNTGILSVGGTADQVIATTTSGAVTLSLPQSIATTSTPTFGGLTLSSPLSVANGGTGATTAALARTSLSAAASGANTDITSLGGLTTALSVAQGGTGATTAADAKTSLGFTTRYSTDVGTGSTTSVTVTHNMGTKDVIVQVFDNSSPFGQIECDVNHTSTTAVTLVFSVAPTSNQYRAVVIG